MLSITDLLNKWNSHYSPMGSEDITISKALVLAGQPSEAVIEQFNAVISKSEAFAYAFVSGGGPYARASLLRSRYADFDDWLSKATGML